jgi:hypothetical protein
MPTAPRQLSLRHPCRQTIAATHVGDEENVYRPRDTPFEDVDEANLTCILSDTFASERPRKL